MSRELTQRGALIRQQGGASTVGYGSIFPVTLTERCFAAVCMIFGGFLFGYIVGGLASVISAKDARWGGAGFWRCRL